MSWNNNKRIQQESIRGKKMENIKKLERCKIEAKVPHSQNRRPPKEDIMGF